MSGGTAARRPRAGAEARRPGRPASDAPERILNAAYEVLRDEGYVGLTTAKVAAESGQNKAMISYYYGSKQGLVAADREAGLRDPDEGDPRRGRSARHARELVTAMTDALWDCHGP